MENDGEGEGEREVMSYHREINTHWKKDDSSSSSLIAPWFGVSEGGLSSEIRNRLLRIFSRTSPAKLRHMSLHVWFPSLVLLHHEKKRVVWFWPGCAPTDLPRDDRSSDRLCGTGPAAITKTPCNIEAALGLPGLLSATLPKLFCSSAAVERASQALARLWVSVLLPRSLVDKSANCERARHVHEHPSQAASTELACFDWTLVGCGSPNSPRLHEWEVAEGASCTVFKMVCWENGLGVDMPGSDRCRTSFQKGSC
ncbi:hypothetical protein MHYP_G00160750 [Metynnis hypsauchen]